MHDTTTLYLAKLVQLQPFFGHKHRFPDLQTHPDHMMLVFKVWSFKDLAPVVSVVVVWKLSVLRSQVPILDEGKVLIGNF